MRCDIVVIGGGNAGLIAAIEARNRGAKVLLIEKAPKKSRGGNSRFSDGVFIVVLEGKKDVQALMQDATLPKGELEVEPFSKDDYYNKAMRLSEGLADKRVTEIFITRSFETAMWMKEQGVKWGVDPRFAFQKDGHTFYPAGEGWLQAAGGSGGFHANPKMRRSCLGENWDLVKLRGTRYDTGDGFQMAIDIGAQFFGHWGGCHASPVSGESPMVEAGSAASQRYSYPYGIMVNRNGERFVDEGENSVGSTYAKFGKEILRQ